MNSDEQRELKAHAKKPASYFVVYTEETFKDDGSDDEEYRDPRTFEPADELQDLARGSLHEGLALEDKVAILKTETARLSEVTQAPDMDVPPEIHDEATFLSFDLPLQIPQVPVAADALSSTFDGAPKHVIVSKMEEPLTHALTFDPEGSSYEHAYGHISPSPPSYSPDLPNSPNPNWSLPHDDMEMNNDWIRWEQKEAEMSPYHRSLVRSYRENLSPRLMKYHDLGAQLPFEAGRKYLDPFLRACLSIPEVGTVPIHEVGGLVLNCSRRYFPLSLPLLQRPAQPKPRIKPFERRP